MWNSTIMIRNIIVTLLIFLSMTCTIIHGQHEQEDVMIMHNNDPTNTLTTTTTIDTNTDDHDTQSSPDMAAQDAAAKRRAEAEQFLTERRRKMAATAAASSASASAATTEEPPPASAADGDGDDMAAAKRRAEAAREVRERRRLNMQTSSSSSAMPGRRHNAIHAARMTASNNNKNNNVGSSVNNVNDDDDKEEQEIEGDENGQELDEEETDVDTGSSTSASEEEYDDEELDEEATTKTESPTTANDDDDAAAASIQDEEKDEDGDDDDDMEKYLADFDTMLNEHVESMESLLLTNRGKMEKHEKLLDTLSTDYSKLVKLITEADETIQKINVRQLEELRNVLKIIYNDEVSRRQRLMKPATATTVVVDTIPEIMTVEELERKFIPETLTVLQQRDEHVQKIITDIIKEKVSKGLDEEDKAYEVGSSSFSSGSNCVTPAEAVETIYQSLVNFSNDAIGRHDHVVTDFTMLPSSSSSRVGGTGGISSRPQRRNGGRMVHEMTSSTYIADIATTTSPKQQSKAALGESWWRQFIPEDWETFYLPAGWEKWDTRLPLWLAHTFHLGGGGGAAAAPPESILQTQILPGACWPMSGATGHVTVALPYPLHVDGISIDHASRALLDNRDEQAKSAPKRVRVIGYPPCYDEDNNSCRGLSFNPHDPLHIMDLEYDIRKTITQTFDVELNGDKKKDEASCAADEEDGTCNSRPSASLSATSPLGKEDVIAAVRFEVLENWGNPDYTCLYRVRVHGKRTEVEG